MIPMIFALVAFLPGLFIEPAPPRVLTAKMHHLRTDGPREWAEFPETAELSSLRLSFQAKSNPVEFFLRLRQRDVKETWRVLINGKPLGRLVQDENAMTVGFPVPPQTLIDGENSFVI